MDKLGQLTSLKINMARHSSSSCQLLGIEFTSKDEFISIVKKLTPETMMHQVVYEIFCLMANEKVKKMNISWSDVKMALVSVYGQDMNRM